METKHCSACGAAEKGYDTECHHCGDNWASHCNSPEGHTFGEMGRETHPLAFGRWVGFVASGMSGGGGTVEEGEPRTSLEEAWQDAVDLAEACSYGDKIAGVRPAVITS